MEKLTIQQNNPFSAQLLIMDNSVDPAVPYNLTGLTVYISIKRRNDYSLDDTMALITSKITVHSDPVNGITDWTLTATQTKIPLGTYKADVRVYVDALDYSNSDTFLVEIASIVTQRLI